MTKLRCFKVGANLNSKIVAVGPVGPIRAKEQPKITAIFPSAWLWMGYITKWLSKFLLSPKGL